MRVLTAGFLLGAGLGGFVDGIVFHQIAQWHNMVSAVSPPHTMEAMSQGMHWDGWFHAAMLVVTFVGVLTLWAEGRAGTSPATSTVLVGEMIFGWGVFNLIEGVIDHHVLGIHHVRDVPVHVPAYDWMFLAIGGVLFMVVGLVMSRRHSRPTTMGGSRQAR